MDNLILKKRLSSFKTAKGRHTKVSDEVLVEMLNAWESWTGTASDFYRDLGLSKMQLGGLLKKAKKLRRLGHVLEGDFKEIKIESNTLGPLNDSTCGIVLSFPDGKRAHFHQVDQLVDFLKKIA